MNKTDDNQVFNGVLNNLNFTKVILYILPKIYDYILQLDKLHIANIYFSFYLFDELSTVKYIFIKMNRN